MIKTPLAILFFFLIHPSSCGKKNNKQDEPNKFSDPAELLINKAWRVSELTFVSHDELFYYKRGGSRNTWDFTYDVITFNADGTGSYANLKESTFQIKWQFMDEGKTKLRYTILDYDMGVKGSGVNLVVNWENVFLSPKTLHYAEIYTNSDGNSIISSGTRVSL